MINFLSTMVAARWRMIILCGCCVFAALGFLALRVRQLNHENARLQTELNTTNLLADARRLTPVRDENERLKADLKSIAALKDHASQLEKEIAAETNNNPEKWLILSNSLQSAIASREKEIADLRHWETEWTRGKAREAAQARLAEKAAEPPIDPSQEYQKLNQIFAQMASNAKQRLESRSTVERKDLPAEERDRARTVLRNANTAMQEAAKTLGSDLALYEGPILNPGEENNPKTVVLRSLVPDLHGLSVTVYLDGTVEWKEAALQAR